MNSQKISAAIAENVNNGMTIMQAVDAVLGLGTYNKIAGEVYDELSAKNK